MPSPFAKYQGGIRAPQGAAEAMSRPGEILAQYISKGFDAIGRGMEKRYDRQQAEQEREAAMQQKQMELRQKYLEDEKARRIKLYEVGSKQAEIDLDAIKQEQEGTRSELEGLEAQMMLFKQTSGKGMNQEQLEQNADYKTLRDRIGNLNSMIAQQNDRRGQIVSKRAAALKAMERELVGPSEEDVQAARNRAKMYDLGNTVGGLVNNVQRFVPGAGTLITAGKYLAENRGLPRTAPVETPQQIEAPAATTAPAAQAAQAAQADAGQTPAAPVETDALSPSLARQGQQMRIDRQAAVDSAGARPEEMPEQEPEVAEASGEQVVSEEILNFRAKHRGTRARINLESQPFANVQGTWRMNNNGLILTPAFAPDADSDVAVAIDDGLQRLRGKSEYTMDAGLSLTEAGVRNATELYNKLTATGQVSGSEISLKDFRAAYAIRAKMNSTGEIRPDAISGRSSMWSDLERENGPAQTQGGAPVPGAFLASDTRQPVSTYTPINSNEFPQFPEQEEFIVIPTKRGIAISGLYNSAVNERNEARKAAYNAEVARRNAMSEGAKAQAALATAQTERMQAQSKEEQEAAAIVAQRASSMPGLTPNSTNRANGFVRYDVPDVARKQFEDIAMESARRAGRTQPGNVDYARAFLGISSIGIDPELARKDIVGSRESWDSFRKGFTASSILTSELERQVVAMNGNFGPVLERIRMQVRPGTAAAANYRMFLLGAFRKSTVGLGNPSNFEQELLLSLIPDPKAIFELKDSALARSRMLMFYQAATLVREMDMHNMELTDQTATELTNMFRSAGVIRGNQKITVAAMSKLSELLQDINVAPSQQVDRIINWVESNGYNTGAEAQFQALRRELQNRWVSLGSEEHAKARSKLMDEINNEPNPQVRARLLEMIHDSYK